jgi:O-antigen/teichoic acid export membrane protein
LVRRYFTVISEVLALAVFPLVFGLAIVAAEVVAVFLGPKWQSAIAPLRWLAVFMAFRSLGTLVNQVLTSMRRTAFIMWMSAVSFIVMPAAFAVAAHWGTDAVAACWIALSPVTLLPSAILLFRILHCPVREYMRILTPALVSSAAMVFAVLGARWWLLPANLAPLWRLALQVAIGAAIYGAVLLGPYRQRVLHYARFFMSLRKDRSMPVGANA